jgi:DNA primase
MKLTFICCKHNESTPSLSVDLITGKYNCFSCGYEGNFHEDEDKTVLKLVINRLETMLNYLRDYL